MKETDPEERGLPPGLKMMAVFGVIMAILVVIAAIFYMRFKKLHDPAFLYEKAEAACEAGDYEEGLERIDEVLALTPGDKDALHLKAELLKSADRGREAAVLYRQFLKEEGDDPAFYKALVEIYESLGDTDSLESLLESAPDEIKADYPHYLPELPVFATEEGAYDSFIDVMIEGASSDTIVFTTDGTDPTETSDVYREPISLTEGRHEIRAAAISEKGIMSRAVTAIYEVTLPLPDPPEILPESGTYEAGTAIMVTLPADSRVYYCFDGVPTPQSELYGSPVPMPEGTHIFSAIVVDANGKVSAPSSQTYIVQ